MQSFFLKCLFLLGFLLPLPICAQFSFQDPPPKQALIRPGEAPAVEQPPAQPAAPAQPQPARNAPQQTQSATPRPSQDEPFYLKKQTVSQETFNQFRYKVAEILKSAQQSRADLSGKLLQMQIKLQAMPAQITMIKQTLVKVMDLLAKQAQEQAKQGDVSFRHMLTQGWFWVMLAFDLLTLILLGVCVYLFLQLKKQPKAQSEPNLDNGGDYDFLSDPESLPSHLDLAQAYIAMGDPKQARKALETVILRDKGALRQQAVKLLKTLPKK